MSCFSLLVHADVPERVSPLIQGFHVLSCRCTRTAAAQSQFSELAGAVD